mmetsp:Transcript_8717/g.19361  ORF Transcript_8717/g.19361 Transcript_8717/m.19361 type:complete len:129 (+) Transcript_8717:783-1169(+)
MGPRPELGGARGGPPDGGSFGQGSRACPSPSQSCACEAPGKGGGGGAGPGPGPPERLDCSRCCGIESSIGNPPSGGGGGGPPTDECCPSRSPVTFQTMAFEEESPSCAVFIGLCPCKGFGASLRAMST